MESKIRYGGKEYGEGDELSVYFHLDARRGTYVARSDEGIVIVPERGCRMVPEMLLGRWLIVDALVKIIKIHVKEDGRKTVIARPLEWRGIYK